MIRTHKRIVGRIIQSGGTTICVNYYPIMKDDVFFGVLIWTIFTGMNTVQKFVDQVHRLSTELNKTKATNRTLAAASYGISNIVGESKAILDLKEQLVSVARTSSSFLILGETGVGKELVAHALHDLSPRRDKRFIQVNCSAIPRDLMEAEFFGYAPGSFTGAQKSGKPGKFELASDGSIFLDEVNLLPLEMQPKLLRALQEREIDRVGGTDSVPVDVRVIAATNCNLAEQIRLGSFREDLYYRLNVVSISVPPLRERKSDIPLLARHMVAKLNYQLGMNISYICDTAVERLMAYEWPGNIRELQNVIERAMNYTRNDTIELRHVESYFLRGGNGVSVQFEAPHSEESSTLGARRAKAERESILRTLEQCGGNRLEAAQRLGIARSTFYRKLEKYGL